jgi:hypothetical protein
MLPVSIDDAIECYAGFNARDASEMTDAEIRAYFSQKNFTKMWGHENGNISDWPWTFSELAVRAIEMVHEYNANPI